MNFLKTRPRNRANSTSLMITSGEKWRKYSRRMSRRGNEVFEDDSEEFEPQYKEVKDWVQEFFERKSDTTDIIDQDIEVHLTLKQTLILSTLVPDELLLLDNFDRLEPKRFVGVLLMADVSGYTALSEHYNNTGKGGTYRLTVTLNTYLGSLTEVIYTHGGDILKFAGDAFLALWKTDNRSHLCHTIHKVIACALVIQHSFASYETDVKVNLKVKLAISAGNLLFAPIGNGIDMNYVIFGLPVIEAKAAESFCPSGEVKLTPSAWGHCYSRNYDHVIDEKGYITIKSILYDPHDNNVNRPFSGLSALLRKIKTPFNAVENLPDCLWNSSKPVSSIEILKNNEVLSLRKTISLSAEKNIGSEIRKFMIRPVLTQIDAHQPLEYLTEMRQVSIVFVTLKPKESSFSQLITIVNNSYQITCEIVYQSMGCVNKIILFDKDVMILVIFGLRGFKHESEAQAALKCAYSVKKSLSVLDGVSQVSIGVTTGQVYCGVVGHPLRREFTVIGSIVNKAARLMCGFRNKITCDESTFLKSKMSSNSFTLQPRIEMKGIGHPGKIYEYTEEIRVKELYDIPMVPPILNRVDEIEYFESWLNESKEPYRDFDALLIIGESRIGKSKMLEWMARHTKNKNYSVSYVTLTSIHSATSYLGLVQIIHQILDLKEPIQGFAKEEKIIQILNTYSDDLCYLNNIIKTRFAYHERIHMLDEKKRMENAKKVFLKLIKAIRKKHVIFLDDLQNLDEHSWEFISLIFNSLNIFTVLSITRGKFSDVRQWLYGIFINNSIRKICLGPLDKDWIPALACQILDVNAVPDDLCNALYEKCKGMPGLIETFIIHLFSTGAIEIKKLQETEIDDFEMKDELLFPDPALIRPHALNAEDQKTLDAFIQTNFTGEIAICVVTDKDELKTNLNVSNMSALIMIQIDSLTPYQQLLLKIASVIGNVVPRHLLENIMYENNSLVTAKAIKRLFAMRILSCANDLTKLKREVKMNTSSYKNFICECNFDYNSEESENLPKYAFCKLLRFRNRNSQKTCYELLPINQKKEFHTRIVTYLENNKQKCTSCGGTSMIVESMITSNELLDRRSSSFETSQDLKIYEIEGNYNDDGNEVINHRRSSETTNCNEIMRVKSESTNQTKDPLEHNRVASDTTFTSNGKSESARKSSQLASILKPNSSTEYDNIDDKKSSKKVTLTYDIRDLQKSNYDEEFSNFFDMLRPITESNDISDWHSIGIVDSTDDIENGKTQNDFTVKLEKGVSQTNFSKCACVDLNIVICEQLIHHALQADLKQKAIEFLIQYTYMAEINGNGENVFSKLDEAEEICELMGETMTTFDYKRYIAKIHSLRAATCLSIGRLHAAKLEIDQATLMYGINFYKVKQYLTLESILKLLRLHRQKRRSQEIILKADSVFCLNTATLLYNILGDEKVSRITATRAVSIIQTVACPLVAVCDSYSNALQVELDRGTSELTTEIESMAASTFKKIPNAIQADELFAIGKLFLTTFRARMARGQLPAAIRSGFRALTISRFIQAEDITLEIIPDIFYVLLSRRRIEEAVNILQFSLSSNENRMSYESEMWYYALCMDMILDAGFQLESPNDISRFAQYAISKGKSAGPSRRRLVLGIWLYWLRAENERKAKRFESEALSWISYETDGTMTNLISAMRLAEGMLESLSRKMDDLRKVVDLMELRSIADRELVRLENDARQLRALFPHWCLLKAFSSQLSDHHTAANYFFRLSTEESQRMYNRLEEALVEASSSDSVIWVQSARDGKFPYWREGLEYAQFSKWHQLMYRIAGLRR